MPLITCPTVGSLSSSYLFLSGTREERETGPGGSEGRCPLTPCSQQRVDLGLAEKAHGAARAILDWPLRFILNFRGPCTC